MFKISKGISMPKHGNTGLGGRQKYPWHEMKVGDSFFVKGAKKASLHSAGYSYSRSNSLGFKFVSRQEKDGARIWRTE